MKNYVLRQLIMLSKRMLYVFILQLIFCTFLLANSGNAQWKTIDKVWVTIDPNENTLLQFFRNVESKTEFKFTYNDNLVDLNQKITIGITNHNLYKILENISYQTRLNFVQVNSNIHVNSQVNNNHKPLSESIKEVETGVTGTVTDAKGESMPGVSITVLGSNLGTVTDLNGEYIITVEDGATLVFSFIGFESQRIEVGGRNEIDVTLMEDIGSLEEVVVIGYGTQKKINMTGAVDVISNEKIENRQAATVSQILQGQSPGLDFSVGNSGFEPGASMNINIRGMGSINGGSPFVLIDGFPGEMDRLNPNDIESISVLKDAAASAIYGARAPYGVILITTKSGRKNEKITISYSGNMSYNVPDRLPEQLDSYTFARVINEMGVNGDLDHAIEHLDLRDEVGNNRINKEAALAFKSRVGLFEGAWQKYHANTVFGTSGGNPARYFQASVDAAKELMSGNYHAGIHDNYYEMFGLDDMSGVNEILMYRAYNINDGVLNDVQYATTFAPVGVGITWSLVTSFLNREGRPFDYFALAANAKGNDFLSQLANEIDPRYSASIWSPGDLVVERNGSTFGKPGIDQVDITLNPTGFQLKKGSNPASPGAGIGGGGSGETGYILFRYGEVLVNYAEALYELEGVVAFDVLNQLRARVDMPDFMVNSQGEDPNSLDYGYPISDELYEIRRERRVELALEGHREDDYRRWAAHELFKGKRPKGYPFNQSEFPDFNPPLDENGLIDFFQNRLPNGFQFRENQDYLNPIPVVELTLNPNQNQNPGWQ